MAWQIDDISTFPDWLEPIVDWHHAEWLRSGGRQNLSNLELAKTRQDRLSAMREHLEGGIIPSTFVAHDKTQPWGTISLVKYQLDQAPTDIWLTNMFVAPKYRRKGVAASLLSYLQRWSDTQNLGVLRLYTFDAADYYLRYGWQYERSTQLRGRVVDVLKRSP